MNSISIKSLPLKDVVRDLAKQFGTDFTNSCQEYSLVLPEKWGEGKIFGINFGAGLGLLFYDCTFRENITIYFTISEVHPLKFLFCENGIIKHRFEKEENWHTLIDNQNAMIASGGKTGHVLKFEGNIHTRINSMEIDQVVFEQQSDCELKSLDKVLETLFRDTKAENDFYHIGFYCLKMADIFAEIKDFSKKDFLKKIFLQACCFKILLLQILQYYDYALKPEKRNLLRKSEIEKVKKAVFLIKDDILDFDIVRILAETVCLNVNKLQQGFKKIYNTTVNGYVQDRRLDMAKHLLVNLENSISQIVYMVGFSSKSYLSKAFKEKYGISPSILRQGSLTA